MDPLFKKSQQFNKLRILAAIMNLKKKIQQHLSNQARIIDRTIDFSFRLKLEKKKKTKEKNRPHKTTIDIDLCRSPPSWGEI